MGRGHFNDLTGRRFTRLTVVERGPSVRGCSMWVVRCDCGTLKTVRAQTLTRGTTASCGCLRSDHFREHLKSMRLVMKAKSEAAARMKHFFGEYAGPQVDIPPKQWNAVREASGALYQLLGYRIMPSRPTDGRFVRGVISREDGDERQVA